ncbi:MAG: protein kinase domain-containing protein [Planctomycetota bacterium]|jgi:serine/threonine protein kinase
MDNDKTIIDFDGRYVSLRVIGKGAFGTVYEVFRHEDGKRFALKAFQPEYHGELDRLRALLDRGVKGDRIVRFEEIGESYAVMELLPMNLREYLRTDPIQPLKHHLVEELLRGLAELHERGVVHGDIKPSNLMIDMDPEGPARSTPLVKLIDFGLISEMDLEALKVSFSKSLEQIKGTFDYLPPERREPGHAPEPRDDLFSAGVVIFEILTGRPAHEALVRRNELPPAYRKFLNVAESRYGSAREALAAVLEFRERTPRPGLLVPPRSFWRPASRWTDPKARSMRKRFFFVACAMFVMFVFGMGLWQKGRQKRVVARSGRENARTVERGLGEMMTPPFPPKTRQERGASDETAQVPDREPPPNKDVGLAIEEGLRWLERHQNEHGDWSAEGISDHCRGRGCWGAGNEHNDLGVTGLALLAFLGAGNTPTHGRHTGTVGRTIELLDAVQVVSGCFGRHGVWGSRIYNQAICTWAMAEAYGLSRKDPQLLGIAQRAVDYLVACQNTGAGWRYGPKPGDSDSSVTGWATLALVSARDHGLDVPENSLSGALRWFDEVTDRKDYHVGYRRIGDVCPPLPKVEDGFHPAETTTAIGVLSRILVLGEEAATVPSVPGGGKRLSRNRPKWDVEAGTIDMYYWHFGALAMFQLGGTYWESWEAPLRGALLDHQDWSTNCSRGSWDPVGAWGTAGGRVYATAINTLTLATDRRYPRRMK